MSLIQCEHCRQTFPGYDITHFTTDAETAQLCTRCFNDEIALREGFEDFDNQPLDPIRIEDGDGVIHEFHLQTRLLGAMVSLEAFEVHNGERSGYQFQWLGTPEEDRFVQLSRLVVRIRTALATKYLEEGRLGLQIKGMEVKGAIDADMSDEGDDCGLRKPMLVIDGRDVSWEEFGRMLMTFEGFKFKLELLDKSEDQGD